MTLFDALLCRIRWTAPGCQVVTVGDSEADFYELFAAARRLETDLLIRVCQEHALSEPAGDRLWQLLARCPLTG